ncbi:MAG: hypothetical protein FWC04_08960, partial [Chitinispirillia bacterium]|nr:hypothetical protein [Chitinispirillia bacterium]
RLPINKYGGITKDWTLITIPLRDFGKRGVFWDAKKRVEEPEPFQWDKVAEFRIEIKKADNPDFKVWVDDIFIVSNVVEVKEIEEVAYWDDRKETLPNIPGNKPAVKVTDRMMNKGDFAPSGFAHVYGGKTAFKQQKTENGESVLAAYMDQSDYSGVTVALPEGKFINLTQHRKGPAGIAFWAKGAEGVSHVLLGILDNKSGVKTQVKVQLRDYSHITTDWQYYMIPLTKFADRGLHWDDQKKIEAPSRMDWSKIQEVRFSVGKFENRQVSEGEPVALYINDLAFIESIPGYTVDPKDLVPVVYWDEREETLPNIPAASKPSVKEFAKVMNKGQFVQGGFAHVYGGKTAFRTQKTAGGEEVLANYMDQSEYSGVTVSIGTDKYIDISKYRTTGTAGLAFWGRGSPGLVTASVGVLDDQGNDVKTQTKLFIGDFGPIDTVWKYYMVPIRLFTASGLYWDANRSAEISSKVDWSKIREIRFSVGRNDEKNRNIPKDAPATFYVSDISFIESIPGYVNPEDFWNAFKSNAPDVMLHNLETDNDRKWNLSHGPKSEGKLEYGESGAPDGGTKSLQMTYRLNDWVDFLYNYAENKRSKEHRDWTKHWGLKFDFYTDKPYQPITVQVGDGGNELWVAPSGGAKGWNEVIVPFRTFSKFPYYQPPEAVENGLFDLQGVFVLDFKPAGEGSRGTFRVDNIRLTNDREAKVKEMPAEIPVTVKGDFGKKLTEKINPGIFGINVALWDADLLLPATEKYVKDVSHGVLRYPGGLRADDDHWEQILKAKDWMVDTDEFLEFCKKTGTEAMITANFGTGTPEEAAKWVKHVNKDKPGNVRYWEIGNELYGSWHPNVTSGDDYGKRAKVFAQKMKEADPKVLVTAVWMLDGEWNKQTFVHLKDVVDGVNVHHYPQHAGQENDAGLLAAPQTLPEILGSVRKQLKDFGNPNKKYEIWLTEWNSVDFDPGPQTMGIVNALFVADYLGMLTKVNIEQASYWDVHNSITPEGGDYGYLSRTGAPDGDNIPRSSYWAFKMASHSLGRGSLLQSGTGDDNVTSYLTQDGSKKSLMIVNKYPKSVANVTLDVPGFQGKAKMQQLTPETAGSPGKAGKGPAQSSIDVKPGMKLALPAYSVTTLTLE